MNNYTFFLFSRLFWAKQAHITFEAKPRVMCFGTFCYFLLLYVTFWNDVKWFEHFGTKILELFGTSCYFLKQFETIWTFWNVFGTFWNFLLFYVTFWNDLNVLEQTFWNIFGTFWNFLLLFETIWNDLIPKCSIIVVTATTYKLLEPSRQARG